MQSQGWWTTTSRVVRVAVHGVLLPLIAALGIVLVAVDLPDSSGAARGEGMRGTFTAEQRECSARPALCVWFGTFDSADGAEKIPDVLLDTDTPTHVGDQVDVLFRGEQDPAVVYLAEGSRTWLYQLFGLVLAVAYLVWAGRRLLVRRRLQRTEPGLPATMAPVGSARSR